MAEVSEAPEFRTRAWSLRLLAGGAVALVLTALGGAFRPAQALASYLTAFACWTATAVGALVFLMIGYATRAKWPTALRRITEGVTLALPALALLALPILFGARRLYPWLGPRETLEPVVAAKHAYLNGPFFALRTAIYFAVWLFVAERLVRWSRQRDADVIDGGEEAQGRERAFSAGMLPLVALAMTFAAFDWLMSLEPTWFSSVYGLYFYAGGQLSALALVAVGLYAAERAGVLTTTTRFHWHALGRLTFAFVVVWAYLGYFQAMLIRIANKPHEVSYFIRRTEHGWLGFVAFVVAGHFVVPFFILLSQRFKERPRAMAMLGAWLVFMHWLDVYWLVLPALHGRGAAPHWLDLTAYLGVGGIAAGVAAWRLHGRLALPLADPFLAEGLRYRSVQ